MLLNGSFDVFKRIELRTALVAIIILSLYLAVAYAAGWRDSTLPLGMLN